MLDEWFLTARRRALVHGADYFARLAEEVAALRAGGHLFFTDWRGDADERLCPEGPTVGEAFAAAVGRGVVVKGLMWRAHRGETLVYDPAGRPVSARLARRW